MWQQREAPLRWCCNYSAGRAEPGGGGGFLSQSRKETFFTAFFKDGRRKLQFYYVQNVFFSAFNPVYFNMTDKSSFKQIMFLVRVYAEEHMEYMM